MCDACGTAVTAGRPVPALLARARAIEAALPGERVPAEAWAIFEGETGGAIAFRHYERLLRCRAAAASERRTGAGLSCLPS
jgi:hypothetical protein